MSRRIPSHVFRPPTNGLTWAQTSPSLPCEPHPVGPGLTDPHHLHHRSRSAGRPRGQNLGVPTSLRTTLLGSLHASPGSGHSGRQRTLSLLQARYWWPSMARDVFQYIRGCSVCAISKTPHHLPTGKLVPLPIPRLGPTSESTSSQISPSQKVQPEYSLQWTDSPKPAS